MTKLQQAMRWIQNRGTITSDLIHIAASELDCSASTIYRARNTMREMKALDGDGNYQPRYISHEEIASLFDDQPARIDIDKVAADLFSNAYLICKSLEIAQYAKLIERVNGGYYGNMYRRVA